MPLARCTLLKEVFSGLWFVVIGLAMALAGCEEQTESEKVFDLKAPGVDIEVEKSTGDGHGTVEVETYRPVDN